jgi:hypothetical protein
MVERASTSHQAGLGRPYDGPKTKPPGTDFFRVYNRFVGPNVVYELVKICITIVPSDLHLHMAATPYFDLSMGNQVIRQPAAAASGSLSLQQLDA